MNEPKDANPEVMGRTEPREVTREPEARPEAKEAKPETTPETRMDFWPQMDEFRRRLAEIQSEFIEEPRAAVQKAEQLIEEAVDSLARAMHERVQRMHGDLEHGADTEKLRQVMRGYKDFIESMGSRRAA